MLRKHLLTDHPVGQVTEPGEKDIAALATVGVTSEATDYPIDNAFDSHRGPGGSRWVAGAPGFLRSSSSQDPRSAGFCSFQASRPPCGCGCAIGHTDRWSRSTT